MKLSLLTATLILSTGAFAQDAPKSPKLGGNPPVRVKPKAPVGCSLVGTVKGTKLWAGDCAAPDQLRSSVLATESSEPRLQDQPTGAIQPGQK